MSSRVSDLESYLSGSGGESGRSAPLSGEDLELMGKRAANAFLQDEVALNDSIAKLAAAHPDISGEQVKRVVEFANNAVYLARHEQSKTAGSSSSYPQFDLADTGSILQDLNDGARPTRVSTVDLDYSRLHKEKVSHVEDDDSFLAGVFGVTKEKISEPISAESARHELLNIRSEMKGLKEHLSSAANKFELSLSEAQAEHYENVKSHLLSGNDFSDVVAAGRSVESNEEKIASVLKPVIERLLIEKVATAGDLQAGVQKLVKIAHRVLNPRHPLVTTFGEIRTCEDELAKIALSISEVDDRLDEVRKALKEGTSARH